MEWDSLVSSSQVGGVEWLENYRYFSRHCIYKCTLGSNCHVEWTQPMSIFTKKTKKCLDSIKQLVLWHPDSCTEFTSKPPSVRLHEERVRMLLSVNVYGVIYFICLYNSLLPHYTAELFCVYTIYCTRQYVYHVILLFC